MATESPQDDRSNEAAVTSVPDHTQNEAHNALLDRAQLNGDAASTATDELENKHITDIVDDLVNSTEVSVSGGSDNEATKSDVAKLKDGDKNHARTSSAVKKPTSFKSISVNKTFLTTKASSSVTPPKVSDKTASPGTLTPVPGAAINTARPRLIAKSGSGLVAKAAASQNGKSGAGPDPSTVWNKNQPAPPPEPKKYTDEELKKYGIHMATRLQADDAKTGQANWADIDDDDDDWTPETITWQDGTKMEIPHADEQQAHPSAAAGSLGGPSPTSTPPAIAPSVVPALVVNKENGPLVKPQSPAPRTASPSIKPGVLASGKGLVLKGAPEKPTLVAKPPAPPTPIKSPWATLPKMDSQPPLGPDVHSNAMGNKPMGRDNYAPNGPMQHPPKEIAADDFSRAPWREGPGGGNRELFNSQSGRYEPVQDRRGSMRPEPPHGRQPGPMRHDLTGPAEPSAAFQTHRTSDQHGPYGRRRGSSNVSGGSGSLQYLRKGYIQPSPALEHASLRRPSYPDAHSPTSPATLSIPPHPGQHIHEGHARPRMSPGNAQAIPYPAHPEAQLMTVPPVQPPVAEVTDQDYETQKKVMREAREQAKKRRLEEEAREEAARKERIRLKLEAMGPAPESNSSKKAAGKPSTPTQIQGRQDSSRSTQSEDKKPDSVSTLASSEPEIKVEARPNEISSPGMPHKEATEIHPQGSGHGHVWPNDNKAGDRFSTPSNWTQPTAKNVWGAPHNNRSLGNGTFVSDFTSSQISQMAPKSGPGPIAPPGIATNQSAGVPSRQPPIGPPKRGGPRVLDNERQAIANQWSAQVKTDDDAFRVMLNSQSEERERMLKLDGRTISDIQPQIKDTWRPTKVDEDGRRAETITKDTVSRGGPAQWAAPSDGKSGAIQQQNLSDQNQRSRATARGDVSPSSLLGASNAAPQASRGSRFFPSKDIRQEAASPSDAYRPKSPSPPPPDMAGHPAFDGDAGRPHVSLPPQKPVVRLPPSASAAASGPIGATRGHQAFGWPNQQTHRDAPSGHQNVAPSHGSDWGAKIKGLFDDRKPLRSPSTSSFPLAVVYPLGSFRHLSTGQDGSIVSKVMAEECFEEQEMGSLPPVRIPSQIPEQLWLPAPAPKNVPRRFLVFDVCSAEPLSLDHMTGSSSTILVLFPGMDSAKSVILPFSRTRSNPRRGRGGGRHNGPTQRSTKGRDGSSFTGNEAGPSTPSSTPSQARRGGGGARGRDWSRNSAAPVQT